MKRIAGVTKSWALNALRWLLEPFASRLERMSVMYVLLQSLTDKGTRPMPVSSGSDVLAVREKIALTVSPGAGDILAMLDLPADHMPVDVILDTDDLDGATPTLTLDVGVLNAAKTDIDVTAPSGGGKWITASTIGQTGGLVRPTTKEITRVTPTVANRKVGVRVAAAATNFQAGDVGLTLLYRAAHHGG